MSLGPNDDDSCPEWNSVRQFTNVRSALGCEDGFSGGRYRTHWSATCSPMSAVSCSSSPSPSQNVPTFSQADPGRWNIRVVSTPSSGPGPAASHLALSRQVYWPPSSHTGLVTHKQPSHAPPPPPLDGSYTSPSLENSTVPEKRPSPPSGSCGPSDPSPGQSHPWQTSAYTGAAVDIPAAVMTTQAPNAGISR